MPLASIEPIEVLWISLSVFFVVVALALAYLLVRLGGSVGRLTSLLQGLEREALPVINQAGGTVERVNAQLDKVDRVTDSAVDIADSADTAVRAVTLALVRPVQKISGLAEGVAHGLASLRAHRSPSDAFRTGRSAARRREQEIADELKREGGDRGP